MTDALLQVSGLSVHYPLPPTGLIRKHTQVVHAVEDVSFELRPGETLGVVGETGCGKSSLGKAVLQLVRPTAGKVVWQGQDLCAVEAADLKPYRKNLQIIFQDPLSSLNPRLQVGEIIAEPLRVQMPGMSSAERTQAVYEMLERVGLRPDMASRYPNEFSGGQCQRISIARAMILEPQLIVCDEPVSALDVSIQAQICNLLRRLQRETGVAMIFISHDLSIVRYMCQHIMVMYLGHAVEIASRDELFMNPRHPYTRALLSAVPEPDPDKPFAGDVIALEGEPPSPICG